MNCEYPKDKQPTYKTELNMNGYLRLGSVVRCHCPVKTGDAYHALILYKGRHYGDFG